MSFIAGTLGLFGKVQFLVETLDGLTCSKSILFHLSGKRARRKQLALSRETVQPASTW